MMMSSINGLGNGGLRAARNLYAAQNTKRVVRPSEMLAALQQAQNTSTPSVSTGRTGEATFNEGLATSGFTAKYNQLNIAEIQQMAEQVGFVGVSVSDIQKAYLQQKSLLVDYKA